MGKSNKVKVELRDSVEMVDLLQTLKDIADNKYFTLVNQKNKFRRFGATFLDFFRLVSSTEVEHPLVHNDNKTTCIVLVTVEGSFLGEFNNKIIRMGMEEAENHSDVQFIAIGDKSVDSIKISGSPYELHTDWEKNGIYETAVNVKKYLVEETMKGRIGKVFVCYCWPKNFETLKKKKIKLLPCDELLAQQQSEFASELHNIIQESETVDVIAFLVNLWTTSVLFDALNDTLIASAAAQAAFLEESVDKQNKELKKVRMKYLKAKKSDIDKSLRETCTARMMITAD